MQDSIYTLKTSRVILKVADSAFAEKVQDPESLLPILRMVYGKLDSDQEHFSILCLNKANRVLMVKTLFSGAVDQTLVDLKVLFRFALLNGATGIIIAHNHPSGRTEPSMEDRHMTQKVVSGCATFDIKLIDHVILTSNAYYSFREGGLL
jgi:DNA repair protein RadC